MTKTVSRQQLYSLALLSLILVIGIVLVFFSEGKKTYTTTTAYGASIDSGATNHWAWNDAIGWIDFYDPPNIVSVDNDQLTGYASSSIGPISLDCGTSPNGNVCGVGSSTAYHVANDGSGRLSGYAWNEAIGYISFCGSQCGNGAVGHQVIINSSNGDFSGYAWNDLIGWISFNCSPDTTCDGGGGGDPDYKVKTNWTATSSSGWLESATINTGVTGGAQINSILWRGVQPAGTTVNFQMAFSSSSAGPWNAFGWDGVSQYSPMVGPNTSLPVNYTLGANQQYFRYRVYLYSDPAHTATPRVDDVIVNWSR